MKSADKVSLIIATYNRGPSIARTLDSVCAQTCTPREIIVVDDCSSDGTGEWVRDHYPEVRVVRPDLNLRTSGARNLGARQACGDILVFLDHDDELMPHALETLCDLLRDHPEATAAHADHAYNNVADGTFFPNHHSAQPAFERLGLIRPVKTTESARVFGRAIYFALLRGNLLQQPWAVYREAFLSLGGFAEDVRYCEDWELYLRLTARHLIALSNAVISYHHVEGENLHLVHGQEEMHIKVLERQLRSINWLCPRAKLILRQRLAQYHKTAGDLAYSSSAAEAWRSYMKSFRSWPFDHVVAARLLLWPIQWFLGRICNAQTS